LNKLIIFLLILASSSISVLGEDCLINIRVSNNAAKKQIISYNYFGYKIGATDDYDHDLGEDDVPDGEMPGILSGKFFILRDGARIASYDDFRKPPKNNDRNYTFNYFTTLGYGTNITIKWDKEYIKQFADSAYITDQMDEVTIFECNMLEKDSVYIENSSLKKFYIHVKFKIISDVMDESNTICMYPNPCHNYFYVSENYCGCDYSIYDIFGHQLKNDKLLSNKIDVSSLDHGIYFIRINNELLQKFIKQ